MKGDNWLHNIDWEQSGLILGPRRKCVTHNAYMRGGRGNLLSQMLRPRLYIYHLTPCEDGSRKNGNKLRFLPFGVGLFGDNYKLHYHSKYTLYIHVSNSLHKNLHFKGVAESQLNQSSVHVAAVKLVSVLFWVSMSRPDLSRFCSVIFSEARLGFAPV